MSELSQGQIDRLIDASENLAAYFAADACRVISEAPDDMNLVDYLENLPVKVVRQFDDAIADIQQTRMDGSPDAHIAMEQAKKYKEAMAAMDTQ